MRSRVCKKSISAFLTAAPSAWRSQNADLAKSYDRFIAKADFWERAGLAALSKRDVAGAITAFKMIASVDPDDHAARLNLGLAYAQSGDATLAKKAFEAVRTSYEGDPDYHVAYGQAHLTTGDKDAAADEFALALEAKPDNMDALCARWRALASSWLSTKTRRTRPRSRSCAPAPSSIRSPSFADRASARRSLLHQSARIPRERRAPRGRPGGRRACRRQRVR